MSDINVCKIDDEFIRDSLRWIVNLNNGDTIYQDDDRPGIEPRSAWVRLKRYCEAHGLYIVRMRIQFRSNAVEVGVSDARGYYFARTAMAVWGEETHHGYIAGHLDAEGKVHYVHWLTPSLIPIEQGVRAVSPEQSDCLIRRPH
jgi:hypothetical protein